MNADYKIQQIKSILNVEWNPIGLSLSEDDDEYESYAINIASREWSAAELQDYLIQAETRNIGMVVDARRKENIVATVHHIMRIIQR
jgi:hypothetical protein